MNVPIDSRDYWIKVVGMLQHNWALIEPDDAGCAVYFVHDASGVFDRLRFDSVSSAEVALDRNGFERYADAAGAQEFISPPPPPFREDAHPNGPIYSSGRFWS